jgi:periplasmic protein TonB
MNRRTKHLMTALSVLAAVQLAAADGEKHLSASESISAAISKPQPEYPAIARQLKLEGTVSLNAFVTEDGAVDHVESVSGNPILVRPAQDALKRWKFAKQTEDGKAVKFVASVIFNFKQQ